MSENIGSVSAYHVIVCLVGGCNEEQVFSGQFEIISFDSERRGG